jgi:hypothetical protein
MLRLSPPYSSRHHNLVLVNSALANLRGLSPRRDVNLHAVSPRQAEIRNKGFFAHSFLRKASKPLSIDVRRPLKGKVTAGDLWRSLTRMTSGLLGASKSPTSVRYDPDSSLKLEEQKLLDSSHRCCAGEQDPLPLLNKPQALACNPSQSSSTVNRRHLKLTLPPLVESSMLTEEDIKIKPPVITLTRKLKSKSIH